MAPRQDDQRPVAVPASGPHALIRLRDRLRAFAAARDWEQFHAPKNLAIPLSVEAPKDVTVRDPSRDECSHRGT